MTDQHDQLWQLCDRIGLDRSLGSVIDYLHRVTQAMDRIERLCAAEERYAEDYTSWFSGDHRPVGRVAVDVDDLRDALDI